MVLGLSLFPPSLCFEPFLPPPPPALALDLLLSLHFSPAVALALFLSLSLLLCRFLSISLACAQLPLPCQSPSTLFLLAPPPPFSGEQLLLDLPVPASVNTSLATAFWQAEAAFVEGVHVILLQELQHDISHAADARAMLLTTITILGAVALLSFLFGTVTALYSAWAVTQPFNQLNLVKEQLTQEKLKRISQSKAVSCFVPYGSLDLLGCDSITSLEMGTSCLRPLTVLFVCLRSFEEVRPILPVCFAARLH